MRRISLAVLLAAVLVPASPALAHDGGRCAKNGSHTRASTHRVRVYWHYEADENTDVLFGCVRRTGRTRRLYTIRRVGNWYDAVTNLRVNGYRVAFASYAYCTVCSPMAQDDHLHLVDLSTGRHRLLKHIRNHRSQKVGANVYGVFLDRCGRVAYGVRLTNGISGFKHPDPRFLTWIRGNRHLVDRRGAEPGSFHFRGRAITWVRDGVRHSAPASSC
jgi:hypothetical protein